MPRKITKIIAIILCLCLLFQQTGFAQALGGEINLSGLFSGFSRPAAQDKFRPVHLRYLSYDRRADAFKLLLDKGNKQRQPEEKLKSETKKLFDYFLIGLALPNETFWVNLRPDSPQNIIDSDLEKTDIGRILLEADVQLKKDTANFTSPATAEGRKYWDSLYKKAEELFGTENITIPTLTRPWIVPGEIIIRESQNNAYIYKATLKVMLEQDYLKDSTVYNFSDSRSKELNEYASGLIRELIIPKLIKEVNTAKKYAALRQVYYSLILSQWFKQRSNSQSGKYAAFVNRKNLSGLTSKISWSKNTYFKQYRDSFNKGEYNLQEPRSTPFGQVIRTYTSGGITLGNEILAKIQEQVVAASPIRNIPEVNANLPVLVNPDGRITITGEEINSPITISKTRLMPSLDLNEFKKFIMQHPNLLVGMGHFEGSNTQLATMGASNCVIPVLMDYKDEECYIGHFAYVVTRISEDEKSNINNVEFYHFVDVIKEILGEGSIEEGRYELYLFGGGTKTTQITDLNEEIEKSKKVRNRVMEVLSGINKNIKPKLVRPTEDTDALMVLDRILVDIQSGKIEYSYGFPEIASSPVSVSGLKKIVFLTAAAFYLSVAGLAQPGGQNYIFAIPQLQDSIAKLIKKEFYDALSSAPEQIKPLLAAKNLEEIEAIVESMLKEKGIELPVYTTDDISDLVSPSKTGDHDFGRLEDFQDALNYLRQYHPWTFRFVMFHATRLIVDYSYQQSGGYQRGRSIYYGPSVDFSPVKKTVGFLVHESVHIFLELMGMPAGGAIGESVATHIEDIIKNIVGIELGDSVFVAELDGEWEDRDHWGPWQDWYYGETNDSAGMELSNHIKRLQSIHRWALDLEDFIRFAAGFSGTANPIVERRRMQRDFNKMLASLKSQPAEIKADFGVLFASYFDRLWNAGTGIGWDFPIIRHRYVYRPYMRRYVSDNASYIPKEKLQHIKEQLRKGGSSPLSAEGKSATPSGPSSLVSTNNIINLITSPIKKILLFTTVLSVLTPTPQVVANPRENVSTLNAIVEAEVNFEKKSKNKVIIILDGTSSMRFKKKFDRAKEAALKILESAYIDVPLLVVFKENRIGIIRKNIIETLKQAEKVTDLQIQKLIKAKGKKSPGGDALYEIIKTKEAAGANILFLSDLIIDETSKYKEIRIVMALKNKDIKLFMWTPAPDALYRNNCGKIYFEMIDGRDTNIPAEYFNRPNAAGRSSPVSASSPTANIRNAVAKAALVGAFIFVPVFISQLLGQQPKESSISTEQTQQDLPYYKFYQDLIKRDPFWAFLQIKKENNPGYEPLLRQAVEIVFKTNPEKLEPYIDYLSSYPWWQQPDTEPEDKGDVVDIKTIDEYINNAMEQGGFGKTIGERRTVNYDEITTMIIKAIESNAATEQDISRWLEKIINDRPNNAAAMVSSVPSAALDIIISAIKNNKGNLSITIRKRTLVNRKTIEPPLTLNNNREIIDLLVKASFDLSKRYGWGIASKVIKQGVADEELVRGWADILYKAAARDPELKSWGDTLIKAQQEYQQKQKNGSSQAPGGSSPVNANSPLSRLSKTAIATAFIALPLTLLLIQDIIKQQLTADRHRTAISVSDTTVATSLVDSLMRQSTLGDVEACRALDRLRSGNTHTQALKALRTLNPKVFIEQAAQGNPDAIEIIAILADLGNIPAQEARSTLYPKVFIEQANQGNISAIWNLFKFYVSGNIQAYEALRTLNPKVFIEQAAQGNPGAIDAVRLLVRSDNTQATNRVIQLARQGNSWTVLILKVISNSITYSLRAAHLEQRVSDAELEKMLFAKTSDNLFLLYSCYTSQENFGALAGMIINRLSSQAKAKGKDLLAFLQELDPQKAFYKDFLLQTASFNQLSQLIFAPEALNNIMDELFKNLSSYTVKNYSVRLPLFVEQTGKDPAFPYQRQFQQHLRSLYDATSGINQRLIAAILTVYKDELGYLNSEDINNIAKEHNIVDVDPAVPYGELYVNGKLTVHIVFADKDAIEDHYDATASLFKGGNNAYPGIKGYEEVSSTDNETILGKGNNRIVLIKAGEDNPYDINQHFNEVGMFESRSHAGSETEVFKSQPEPLDASGKIIFPSACRSATVIGNISKSYPGADYIGGTSTVYGTESSILTYYYLEALGKKIPTYGGIAENLMQKPQLREILNNYVLPGAPALRVQKIVSGSSPVNANSPIVNQVKTINGLKALISSYFANNRSFTNDIALNYAPRDLEAIALLGPSVINKDIPLLDKFIQTNLDADISKLSAEELYNFIYEGIFEIMLDQEEKLNAIKTRPNGLKPVINSSPVKQNDNLLSVLKQKITQAGGRITFAEFMDLALNGEHGYYAQYVNIDRNGDFITDAENRRFAEKIAEQIINMWSAFMNSPQEFKIVEMGAGTGALARNILNYLKTDPQGSRLYNSSGFKYIIVEKNARPKVMQKDKLVNFKNKVEWKELDDLANVQGVFISNELVDALPIHIIKKEDGRIKEIYITTENGIINEQIGPISDAGLTDYLKVNDVELTEGQEIVISPDAINWQAKVAQALKKGFVITADYGVEKIADFANHKNIVWSANQDKMDNARDSIYQNINSGRSVDITWLINFADLIKEGKKYELNNFTLASLRDSDFSPYQDPAKFTSINPNFRLLMQEKGIFSSPVKIEPVSNKGGIDFRAMPVVTQPVPPGTEAVFKPILQGQSPAAGTVPNIKLSEEWRRIKNMVDSGIIPSGERLKEYVQACCTNKEADRNIDKVLSCIAQILRLEEERVQATDPQLRKLIVLLESGKPAKEIRLAVADISFTAKEPVLSLE